MSKSTKKIVIGVALIASTYFTTLYASTVDILGMQAWGTVITIMLFMAGLLFIIFCNE